MDLSLTGKVAIVTGGRRGIGQAIALALAEAGADVALGDMVADDGELEKVAAEIRKLGRRALAIQADVSKKADVDNMVQKVMDEFGRIDILVNNAGVIEGEKTLLDIDENTWDWVMGVNLKGCWLCSQAVAKIMIEQKQGNIINISSLAATHSTSRMSRVYGVSKAGQAMITQGLAWDLGKYNIRVNAILPCSIETEMTRPLINNPEILPELIDITPLHRLGQPNEVSDVALFLASEGASYITGHSLVVDGGVSA